MTSQADISLLRSGTIEGLGLTDLREVTRAYLEVPGLLSAILDRHYNFIQVSQAYADAGRRRPEQFVGRNHFDLYPDAGNQAIFDKVVSTGESFVIKEKVFLHPDQPERPVTYWDWSLLALKEPDGRVWGLLFTLLDITDRVLMEKAVRNREILLRELHHRVKNNLQTVVSLITLHRLASPDLEEPLTPLKGRIDAMAKVHELLSTSDDLAVIDFGRYANSLCRDLEQLFGSRGIGVSITIDMPVSLSLDTAMPLALIVNELLTNCFKHGGVMDRRATALLWGRCQPDGTVEVKLVQESERPIPPSAGKALGLGLVDVLLDQLGATMTQRFQPGHGMVWQLAVPPSSPP
ncbi:MAG TPA: histidine kinase dimerization/phosphoacceptor domain -containing protein [Azospirillaceae bacterium]|nr:histidine kinase dimerization/phosphoacceptor domain -containing protein [Azospirillaceae bacterium]